MTTEVVAVDTPVGLGRLLVSHPAGSLRATLLLGHGAGGGPDAADLALLAQELPGHGVRVARFEQPWRTAGRKVAAPAPQLDQAWRSAVATAGEWSSSEAEGLFFGGRSSGARVACRTAPEYDVLGVVCLAFPLHPPGRPDRSRAPELVAPTVPRLVLQGSSDAFGGPTEIRRAVEEAVSADPGSDRRHGLVRVVDLVGADHGFRVAKSAELTAAGLRALVAAEVSAFLADPVLALTGAGRAGE